MKRISPDITLFNLTHPLLMKDLESPFNYKLVQECFSEVEVKVPGASGVLKKVSTPDKSKIGLFLTIQTPEEDLELSTRLYKAERYKDAIENIFGIAAGVENILELFILRILDESIWEVICPMALHVEQPDGRKQDDLWQSEEAEQEEHLSEERSRAEDRRRHRPRYHTRFDDCHSDNSHRSPSFDNPFLSKNARRARIEMDLTKDEITALHVLEKLYGYDIAMAMVDGKELLDITATKGDYQNTRNGSVLEIIVKIELSK